MGEAFWTIEGDTIALLGATLVKVGAGTISVVTQDVRSVVPKIVLRWAIVHGASSLLVCARLQIS